MTRRCIVVEDNPRHDQTRWLTSRQLVCATVAGSIFMKLSWGSCQQDRMQTSRPQAVFAAAVVVLLCTGVCVLLACVLRCARGVLQYRAAAAGVHPTEVCPALFPCSLAPGTQHCAAVMLLCLGRCACCTLPRPTSLSKAVCTAACAVQSCQVLGEEDCTPRSTHAACWQLHRGHGSGAGYKSSTLSGEEWRLLICAVGVDPVADISPDRGPSAHVGPVVDIHFRQMIGLSVSLLAWCAQRAQVVAGSCSRPPVEPDWGVARRTHMRWSCLDQAVSSCTSATCVPCTPGGLLSPGECQHPLVHTDATCRTDSCDVLT